MKVDFKSALIGVLVVVVIIVSCQVLSKEKASGQGRYVMDQNYKLETGLTNVYTTVFDTQTGVVTQHFRRRVTRTVEGSNFGTDSVLVELLKFTPDGVRWDTAYYELELERRLDDPSRFINYRYQ